MKDGMDTTGSIEGAGNIVKFGPKAVDVTTAPEVPTYTYAVTDIDGTEFLYDGFLIFTVQHVAVMRPQGDGAVPLFVMPLHRLKNAEIVEDEDQAD